MSKIQFEDKVDLTTKDIPEINKITADNMNEIKDVVNINDDTLSSISQGAGTPFDNLVDAMVSPLPDGQPFFTTVSDRGQYFYDSTKPEGYVLSHLFTTVNDVFDKEDDVNPATMKAINDFFNPLIEAKDSNKDYKNLFNILERVDGYYIKYNTGEKVSNSSFSYVRVEITKENTQYTWSNQGVVDPTGVSKLQQFAYFDVDDNYISGDVGNVNTITFDSSTNIKYVYLNISNSYLDYEYQLNIGSDRGEFFEYVKPNLNIFKDELSVNLQRTLKKYIKEIKTFSDDNSKDYNNLREALESCTDTEKEYEIWLYSSVSNVLTEYFTEVEINDSDFKGLDIPNNVTLVNPDLSTEISLRGFLDDGIYDSTTRNRVSTLNFIYNGGLKGIKVIGENVRYAVHDDIQSDKINAIRLVEDCIFEKVGTDGFTQAYGAGTRSGMIMTIKNSKFSTDDEGASFSCHNNTSFTKPSKIILENNTFRSVKGYNSVAFGSINSGVDDEIIMIGNNLNNGIRLFEEGAGVGNGINFKLSGYGNTKIPVFIEHTDVAQYTYDFNEDVELYRNRAGSTITKGKLVYLNDSGTGGIRAMSSSYPNRTYGIAFEDIPTLELGKIKPFKSGQWIAISDTVLTGTSIGDKIGIDSNGVLEITTGVDYIGVVLLNDFIRLK